jgi:choline dehydrogenase-like flavoprotein
LIEDLRESPRGTTISADVCLIGAGAAGITIARELAGSALRVCLIEGGGMQYEYQDSQALYQGASVGDPVSLMGGRLRFFGGTTNHWGGRCTPLDEIDFRQRDWIPHSGWPIDRAALDPYYARAQKVAGFPTRWLSEADTLSFLKIALPSINGQWIKPFLWHYAPAMKDAPVWKWGGAYGKDLQDSRNVQVLLHANFTAFTTEEDRSRVRSMTVKSLNGVSATIVAKNYVLCCGGIENARLLLLGAAQNSGAFGNNNDLVGRYFMQHPRGPAGLIVSPERMSRVQEQFNILRGPDGLQIEIGLALAPQIQEIERLLNCSAVLQYQGDPESGVTAAQDIWRSLLTGSWPPGMGEKVARIAGDFGAFAHGLEHRLSSGHSLALEGSAGVPSRSAIVLLDLEQAPNPDSRISLAEDRDALGLPRVKADWRLGQLERRTAARFINYIGAEFARLGIGRCQIEPWLQNDRIPMSEALSETYHYIGTTRMADDPRKGVVDKDCAVHGMNNLYVAGSSVFPTAGQANPTLTIVALALRLADRLKL